MNQQQILQTRLETVRGQFANWGIDCLLVNDYTSYFWLSGFSGSNCTLLITQDNALLATDFRYYGQAQKQASHFTLFKHERRAEDDVAFLNQIAATRIGFNAQQLTIGQLTKWQKANEAIAWQALEKTIEPLRMIKTAVEIEKIRRAAAITDVAMLQVPEIVKPGMSEKQVAWALEKAMRDAGADGMAFDVLIASGPNSALPHHKAGSRKIWPGDALIVDMGAMLDGYRSDLTRSFFVGNEPTEQYQKIYQTVLTAQTAVLENAKPPMGCKAVDSLARDLIIEAGYGDYYGHGGGHGVGLDIHEDPFLSQRATDAEIIEAGMTLTVEPGIYIPDWGGVRIEDLTVVTDKGLERISYCPKTPIVPV